MAFVDGSEEIAWLTDGLKREVNWALGVEVPGYPARVRLLHTMWEDPDASPDAPSYDEAFRAAPPADATEAINQILEGGTVVGIGMGPTRGPDGWQRLTWQALAERWGATLDYAARDPLSGFDAHLAGGSWSTSIRPPTEGSLDWEAMQRLVPILLRHTDSSDFWRLHAWNIWTEDPVPNALWHGSAADLVGTYDKDGSGENWWPEDRAWLVFTDRDLSTTNVQGTPELIAEINADEFLETIELEPYVRPANPGPTD